jgi:hypothetical protein
MEDRQMVAAVEGQAFSGVPSSAGQGGTEPVRRVRADVRRNEDAILEAAKVVLATSGVDAPVRKIAAQAGVGVSTLSVASGVEGAAHTKRMVSLLIDGLRHGAPMTPCFQR